MKIDKNVNPKQFDKNEFVEYLIKNKIRKSIVSIINKLPNQITFRKYKYDIFINKIWYNKGETYYKFELNYYSSELNEFLLPLKVFTNVENSVKYLFVNLKERKLI